MSGIFSSTPKPKVVMPAQAPSVEGAKQSATDTGLPAAPESLVTSGSATGLTRKARTQKTSLIGGA